MNKEEINNNTLVEYKMYITDLETNKNSKEINVSNLVFNDYIEFEFGNYEDEDYETLPYKDFKFFINDYSVTFYSPQMEQLQQENKQIKEEMQDLTADYGNKAQVERDLLQLRINKAIDFIENNFFIENCLDLKEIIKILRGE